MPFKLHKVIFKKRTWKFAEVEKLSECLHVSGLDIHLLHIQIYCSLVIHVIDIDCIDSEIILLYILLRYRSTVYREMSDVEAVGRNEVYVCITIDGKDLLYDHLPLVKHVMLYVSLVKIVCFLMLDRFESKLVSHIRLVKNSNTRCHRNRLVLSEMKHADRRMDTTVV
jgi:hypothetical protein